VERVIPTSPVLDAFIRQLNPDLLLVTPLIEIGSQQVDYVKSARRLGIRSALCVASWDNLTSKGLIRVIPDRVIVWNEFQKREAVDLHGVTPDRVVVTGAQLFDSWFQAEPAQSRQEFCRMVGLDAARRFVLYVGSSSFIAPDEVPFVERWIWSLRQSADPEIAGLGILVRPHPANARQWRMLDLTSFQNVAIWPPIGTEPSSPDFRRDYLDSLSHCAAVVGINTSAQLEAAIVGRPVFTIRAPEFAQGQEGTLHFQYLVKAAGGLVQVAGTLDEHVAQLRTTWQQGPDVEQNRRFLGSFIRPHGLEVPATPLFVEAIERLEDTTRPESGEPGWVKVGRLPASGLAYGAHTLAEDRPLWVYLLLRPLVGAAVLMSSIGVRSADAVRSFWGGPVKRMRRQVHKAWHESSQRAGKNVRHVNKTFLRRARSAGAAAKRVVRGLTTKYSSGWRRTS
jgi:hypothetical protein